MLFLNLKNLPPSLRCLCKAASPILAGNGFPGVGGDELFGPLAILQHPAHAVMDPKTLDLYIADYSNYMIRVVSGKTGRETRRLLKAHC